MIMTREELQNEFGDAVCVYCNKNIIIRSKSGGITYDIVSDLV